MRLLIVCLALLSFGAARLPWEHKLAMRERAGNAQGVALSPNLREQVGQLGFIAALSGFRSLVADLVFIQAHVAWERTEWGRVLLLFRQATALQPHSVLFWDMAAWHMAWNASAAAVNDQAQPRAALRIKAQREYFALGRDFLERGIQNNPAEARLYESLARLYRDKYKDHARAAEYFAKAAELPGAMGYDKRFSAYELSYVEGRERAAYERLRHIYDAGEKERAPTLIARLKFLEAKLDIPLEQRIPETAP